MQHHYPIVAEQFGAPAEKGIVMADADVLKHAHGNDAIKLIAHVPIILQQKSRAIA
jgi:hypothetical protein